MKKLIARVFGEPSRYNPISKYFTKIKGFRLTAIGYDKTDYNHAAFWNLVAALIALR
jgi:hypothetical protein